MSFDDFQRHCKKCKKGEPCGEYHVYVMELSKDVIDSTKFRKVNPNYKPGMDCVYVGKTAHHPRCRQSMHNNCKIGNWTQLKTGKLTRLGIGNRKTMGMETN